MSDPASTMGCMSRIVRSEYAASSILLLRTALAVVGCAALGACTAQTTRSVAVATPPLPVASAPIAAVVKVAPAQLATTETTVVARPIGRQAFVLAPKPRKLGVVGVGIASWYGDRFHGRRTANGERYDMASLSAAHPTLPLPSYVRVTNVQNGRSVVVRVNDRGPFHRGRLIDVSRRTADVLGFRNSGVGNVKVDFVGPASAGGSDDRRLIATYQEFGRPSAPAGIQVAGLRPVSDAEIAQNGSSAVRPLGAPAGSSSVMLTAAAQATPASDKAPTQPTAFAAAASAPVPAVLTALRPSVSGRTTVTAAAPSQNETPAAGPGKRVIQAVEPVLASSGPQFEAASPVSGASNSAVRDPLAASRIAASFESFSSFPAGSASAVGEQR